MIDGSDPSVSSAVYAASQSVGQAQSMRILKQATGIDPDEMVGVEVRPRVWYNPEMKSANFMVPGIIGTVIFLLTTTFTAMSVVREREQGTIEQLIVTPIQPIELIIGKVVPFAVSSFINVINVLALGVTWFGMPINGSLSLLLLLSVFFIITSLGLGIFISSVSNTQQEAMLLSYLIMIPSIFLGGFFFPIEAMPRWLQVITYLIPLRYILIIIRGVVLKGVGLSVLRSDVLAMSAFGLALLLLAAISSRTKLD